MEVRRARMEVGGGQAAASPRLLRSPGAIAGPGEVGSLIGRGSCVFVELGAWRGKGRELTSIESPDVWMLQYCRPVDGFDMASDRWRSSSLPVRRLYLFEVYVLVP